MGTWHVDREDEASMAEDVKYLSGRSRRNHELCWVRSQDRLQWLACTFWAYFQYGACNLFPPPSGLPLSSLGGCHYLLGPMRAIPLTQTPFSDSHIYTAPGELAIRDVLAHSNI